MLPHGPTHHYSIITKRPRIHRQWCLVVDITWTYSHKKRKESREYFERFRSAIVLLEAGAVVPVLPMLLPGFQTYPAEVVLTRLARHVVAAAVLLNWHFARLIRARLQNSTTKTIKLVARLNLITHGSREKAGYHTVLWWKNGTLTW